MTLPPKRKSKVRNTGKKYVEPPPKAQRREKPPPKPRGRPGRPPNNSAESVIGVLNMEFGHVQDAIGELRANVTAILGVVAGRVEDIVRLVDGVAAVVTDTQPIGDDAMTTEHAEDHKEAHAALKQNVGLAVHGLKAHIEEALKSAESGNTAAFKAAAAQINQFIVTLENLAGVAHDPKPDATVPPKYEPSSVEPSKASETATDAPAGAPDLPAFSASESEKADEEQSRPKGRRR
jgi:hypothetical protein